MPVPHLVQRADSPLYSGEDIAARVRLVGGGQSYTNGPPATRASQGALAGLLSSFRGFVVPLLVTSFVVAVGVFIFNDLSENNVGGNNDAAAALRPLVIPPPSPPPSPHPPPNPPPPPKPPPSPPPPSPSPPPPSPSPLPLLPTIPLMGGLTCGTRTPALGAQA